MRRGFSQSARRQAVGRAVEHTTIDDVPERERYGRLLHQAPFWFLGHLTLRAKRSRSTRASGCWHGRRTEARHRAAASDREDLVARRPLALVRLEEAFA